MSCVLLGLAPCRKLATMQPTVIPAEAAPLFLAPGVRAPDRAAEGPLPLAKSMRTARAYPRATAFPWTSRYHYVNIARVVPISSPPPPARQNLCHCNPACCPSVATSPFVNSLSLNLLQIARVMEVKSEHQAKLALASLQARPEALP